MENKVDPDQIGVKDVVIIGGGPAGLAASLYNARANFSPLVLAGSPPGGQLMLTSDVENYPGFESILGPDLIQKYREHTQKFTTRIVDENAAKLDLTARPFKVYKADGNYILTKSIIIATGAKALWLGLENETRLRGKGVSACATCDGFFFKEKQVAVIGGGDTAMEEALTLTKFASKVYVIHRRDSFRASKIMQDRVLKHPKIKILWNTVITDVLGENKVEGIKLSPSQTDPKPITNQLQTDYKPVSTDSKPIATDSKLNVDGLFLAIGHKPDTDFLKGSGVELDEKGYVITSQRLAEDLAKGVDRAAIKDKFDFKWSYMTSVPGVFAAGDNVDYLYRQAGTAIGMGIAAALEAERWLEASGLV